MYDRKVLSVGYNGAPSGKPHCTGRGCQYHVVGVGCQVLHAEMNALDHAPFLKTAQVHDLYVTHSPCMACATDRRMGYVRRVFFETAYRDSSPVQELLMGTVDSCVRPPIDVYQLLPSGLAVDQRSGDLVELA